MRTKLNNRNMASNDFQLIDQLKTVLKTKLEKELTNLFNSLESRFLDYSTVDIR